MEDSNIKSSRRQPWLLRDILYLYLLGSVLFICEMLVIYFITGEAIEDVTLAYMSSITFLFLIILLCLVIFFVKKVYGAKVKDIGLTLDNLSQGIIYGLCGGAIFAVGHYLLSLFGFGDFVITDDIIALDLKRDLFFNVIELISVVVLSPVVMATLFVGFIYTILLNRFSKRMAVFLSCCIMALTLSAMAPGIKRFFVDFIVIFLTTLVLI